MASTITQKTVGTSAVQLTADTPAATRKLDYGVIVTWDATTYTGNMYWGQSNGVTTANGMLLINGGQIAAGGVNYVGDIWLISSAAAQKICCEIVAQTVVIS